MSSFTFKQFTIHQDKTAMKAGTDGVLLGAWCDFSKACRVLDIGTGTGLVALMAAQKSAPKTLIDAIEIDEDAFKQASENAGRSRFASRIKVVHGDFLDFAESESRKEYDCIVSNPPFFENGQRPADTQRSLARHTDSLPFGRLIGGVSEIISPQGFFSVIIPAASCLDFVRLCALRHMHLCRKTLVFSKEEAIQPLRALLTFSKEMLPLMQDTITINLRSGKYTEQYIRLTQDFYL